MSIEFTVFKGSATGAIVEGTTRRAAPTGTQVLVNITHSGICGSDEHFKHKDMVLGHEGVGTVQQLGADVKGFKIGDVVGWGFNHKTCGNCEQCLAGELFSLPRKLLVHVLSSIRRLGHDHYCETRQM
jgi:D-arabinose 1-dehydrogenase-like Zn-dependent alcohol dehydrogenase